MISANNLSIQFGAKPLFENVSATFGNGNRYGLIGANGCGKSTLMKILAKSWSPLLATFLSSPMPGSVSSLRISLRTRNTAYLTSS
jgi:ATPase subunit of ABC transporter with duplicated ATPase domains